MIDKKELVATREYIPSDYNFIMATWLRGLFYGDSWFSMIPKDIFMSRYHKVLEGVLSSPEIKIKVACLKTDPEAILSYLVTNKEETIVHWVFTKKAWRSIGLAKGLFPASGKYVTHLTKVGINMLKKHEGLQFNPFVI